MASEILFATPSNIDSIAKAINSPLRRKMLSLLRNKSMNITELCIALSIPQSTCATNIQILEKAGLLECSRVSAETHGTQKVCTLKHDKVLFSLFDDTLDAVESNKTIVTEMPIGLFSDAVVTAPCGIVSEKGIIGYYDNPYSFLLPSRASAGLLWFTYGYLEYKFPKNFDESSKLKSLSISAELCSEYPGHNNSWPSDITLMVNGKDIGTWTSSGDNGGKRGLLTPGWWSANDSQYGALKTWTIREYGTFFEDGTKASSTRLQDIDIEKYDSINVRIAVKEDATNRGGLNLFGSRFGNYPQDLELKIELI